MRGTNMVFLFNSSLPQTKQKNKENQIASHKSKWKQFYYEWTYFTNKNRIYIMMRKREREKKKWETFKDEACCTRAVYMDYLNVKNVNRMVANEWITTNGNSIIDNSRILKKRSVVRFRVSLKWAKKWMPKWSTIIESLHLMFGLA